MNFVENKHEYSDIKSHAARGFKYSFLSQGIKIVVQFLTVVVMAKLLTPEDFGLIAKVTPVYALALLFNDLGLSQATIQKPSLQNDQINTFFWINVFFGLFVTLVLIAASPLVAIFYSDPRTIGLTIAFAILVFVASLGNQHGALMLRRMDFRAQGLINSTGAISAMVVAILTGLFYPSYWALFAGMAAGCLVPTAGAWLSVNWRPSFPKIAAETREMLRYGLGITSANLVDFFVTNFTNVITGWKLGDRQLGIYDRSNKLLYSPLQQILLPISSVVLPVLYRLHDNNEKYKVIFLRALSALTLLIVPGVIWLTIISDHVIEAFLGPKWLEASPVFAVLSLAAIPQIINSTATWLLITQGRSKDYARLSTISGIISIIAVIVGLQFGIFGVAVAITFVQLLKMPIYWTVACNTGPVHLLDVIQFMRPHLLGLVTTIPLMFGFIEIGITSNSLILTFLGFIVAYIIFFIMMLVTQAGRKLLSNELDFIMFVLGKKQKY